MDTIHTLIQMNSSCAPSSPCDVIRELMARFGCMDRPPSADEVKAETSWCLAIISMGIVALWLVRAR